MLIDLENPNLQFDRRRNRPPNGVCRGEYWDVLDMEVGKEIPLSKENIYNFKIAKWVGDSGTGDFDFVVYGRYDG